MEARSEPEPASRRGAKPRAAAEPANATQAPGLALGLAALAGGAAVLGAGPWSGAAAAVGALGAWLLAGALGTPAPGAALAALAFGLAAAVVGEGAPGGAALLPWVLWGLEAARRAPGPVPLAFVALASAGLWAAGPPAAAVGGSVAAAAWALCGGARVAGLAALAGGLGLAGLAGFLPAVPPAGEPAQDPLALGALLLLAGAVAYGRRGPEERGRGGALALGAALAALGAWLGGRGLDPRAPELLLPGLAPPGPPPPVALPSPALALGLAGVLAGAGGPRLAGGAALLLPLALSAPGVAQVWGTLPVLGGLDPAGLGGAAALALALLAGRAWCAAGPRPRLAAGAAWVGLGAASAVASLSVPAAPTLLDPPDALVDFRLHAAGGAAPRPGAPLVDGTVHPGLPAARIRLRLERAHPGAVVVLSHPLEATSAELAPRPFAFACPPRGEALGPGRWLLTLELLGGDEGEPDVLLGDRRVALVVGRPSTGAIARALVLFALGLVPLALGFRRGGFTGAVLVLGAWLAAAI